MESEEEDSEDDVSQSHQIRHRRENIKNNGLFAFSSLCGESRTLRLMFRQVLRPARFSSSTTPFLGMYSPRRFFRPLFLQIYEECAFEVNYGFNIKYQHAHIVHMYLLTRLLQRSIMSRNYIGASGIMASLSYCPTFMLEHLWRVGSQVLKQIQAESYDSSIGYLQLMFDLCFNDQVEVALGLIFDMLKTSHDLYQSYQFAVDKKRRNCSKDGNELYLDAYIGLFQYVLWKMDFDKAQRDYSLSRADAASDCMEDEEDDELDPVLEKSKSGYYVTKAIKNLHFSSQRCGVWDIFITKYVQILHILTREDEVEQRLTEYRNRNLKNPNAHRYLYWYLKTMRANEAKLVDVLRIARSENPASELSSDLLMLIKAEGKAGDEAQLLFEDLDFVCNRDNISKWKQLDGLLHQHLSETDIAMVNEVWESRSSWWPSFHLGHLQDNSSYELDVIKRRVFSVLNVGLK